MQFGNPNILALLLIFPPALLAFSWWSNRKRQLLMAQFIQSRLLPGLVAGVSTTRQKLRWGCLVGAVVCVILALARPQWGFIWEEVKVRGVDIVVAIDTSKSMLATDIAPDRLTRAKLAALDLMQFAKSDRLGLVAFAGSAFLQCPLTIDDSAFRQSVEALSVTTIPEGGTDLSDAIMTAQTAFKEGDNHRVLVLLTDGEDQDSGALEVAQKAGQAGLKIFTVGVGTPAGELLKISDAQGKPDYIRDEQGNVVKSHLNEELLRQIAGATQGGFYVQLLGAKTMDTLYENGLANLPKSEHQQKLVKQYEERYQWPLGLAVILLVLEVLVPERKREALPAALPAKSGTAPIAAAVVLLVSLGLASSAIGSPSSALREYQSGKYDEALKEYQKLLQRKSDDPRLHFNAGAAAYRDRQYDQATKEFNNALASPDVNLQQLSYYNRGNAQYRLGENNPDPSKRTELWEKSLKDYDLSMKLNPQDPDARFNHDFVKRRLEELKRQQQQQQNSQQNKSDQKDQQDQQKQDQRQQQQDQQKKDQQQNQQSKEDQNQQQQGQKNQQNQQQQNSQQAQQQKQDQQQQQAARQAQEQKQNQQASKPPEKQDQAGETNQQQYAAGQMTPEQARQLLDAQKGDEKMLQPSKEGKPSERSKPLRDW
jgi:Ca-activated chloride channel family protein